MATKMTAAADALWSEVLAFYEERDGRTDMHPVPRRSSVIAGALQQTLRAASRDDAGMLADDAGKATEQGVASFIGWLLSFVDGDEREAMARSLIGQAMVSAPVHAGMREASDV